MIFQFNLYIFPFCSFQVRVENVENPSDYIGEVLCRVKLDYIVKTYKIVSWSNATDFLEQLAARYGKLFKVIA